MNKKEKLKAANEEFKLYGKYKVNTENNSVTIEEGKIILKPLFFSLV